MGLGLPVIFASRRRMADIWLFVTNEYGSFKGLVRVSEKISFRQLKKDNKIGCSTAVVDTRNIGKVYMSAMAKRQDWAYFLTIMKKCDLACGITEPLVVYTLRNCSVSSDKLKLLRYNADVYRQVFGYGVIFSYLYLFMVFMPTYTVKKVRNAVLSVKYRAVHKDLLINTEGTGL